MGTFAEQNKSKIGQIFFMQNVHVAVFRRNTL